MTLREIGSGKSGVDTAPQQFNASGDVGVTAPDGFRRWGDVRMGMTGDDYGRGRSGHPARQQDPETDFNLLNKSKSVHPPSPPVIPPSTDSGYGGCTHGDDGG